MVNRDSEISVAALKAEKEITEIKWYSGSIAFTICIGLLCLTAYCSLPGPRPDPAIQHNRALGIQANHQEVMACISSGHTADFVNGNPVCYLTNPK